MSKVTISCVFLPSHCMYRLMYWTEGVDSDATIRRAALDGTNIISVATNVNGSNDISVDTIDNRVYWNAVSGNLYQILSSSENSSSVTTVYDSGLTPSGSLSVFEDYVYFVEINSQIVIRADKYARSCKSRQNILNYYW